MDLTTLNDVKGWLSITSTTDDELLSRLITGASAFIESWCTRSFALTQYTDVLNGKGSNTMLLGNYPITAVSFVKVDNISIHAAADCTQIGYAFDDIAVYLQGGQIFTKGIRNVTITYTAGYADVPADIAMACFELVGKKYRERAHIGQTSKTLAGEIVSFMPSDLSKETMSMLRSYNKVVPI